MSRSVTDYVICSFSEWWKEDYEYTFAGTPYMEGNSPIKAFGFPGWYPDRITDQFYGRIHHSFEMRVSATESYRLAGGLSEHLLRDSDEIDVIEVWEGKDFDDNTVYGPTEVVTTRTVAQIEASFPFLRKSLSQSGTLESVWFSFNCGEAGEHYCSPIQWYGSTLNWPEIDFDEDYGPVTVTSGFYTGEEVFGSVDLTSGSGGILCGCTGGYERTGNLRLASYHVEVDIVGEGPNAYRVKCSPVDFDGNAVGAGNKCYVLFGQLYRVDASDSHKILSVDNASYTGDVSRYCFQRTLPLDEEFEFPLVRVRDNSVVYITTVGVGGFTTPAIPGWESYPSSTQPVRFQDDHEQELRSHLVEVQTVLDKEEFFGLDPAPRMLANFDAQHPGCLGLHRFHEAAGATQKEVATVAQSPSKLLGSGYITWGPNGGASFAIDGITMVFTTPSGSGPDFFLDNPQVWNFRPYRYLTFDYEVVSGGPVTGIIRLNDLVSTRAQKEYHFTLSGEGTKSIDLCWPNSILTTVSGEGATLMASRLNTENQADRVGVTDSAYAGTGTPLKERFTGVRGCQNVTLIFSGPSVVRIRNFRKTADQARIQFNHWTQQKTELFDAGAWGDLDFKDAYRVSHLSTTVKGFLDKLGTQQSMTVTHGSYGLDATWVSPTTTETLGSLNLGTGTVYGWFSQFTGGMEWIGKRDCLSDIPVWVTLGAQRLKGYTGIGESGMFDAFAEPTPSPLVVQTEFVVGSLFSMTAFKRVKGTVARIVGTSGLGTIDETYTSLTGGYGHKALDRYRPKDITADPAQSQNLEHYIPKHPDPETKQLVFNTGLRNVFWIGVQGVPEGGPKVSYDVSPAMRHYRAWIDDEGKVWTGYAGNELDWTDSETEIDAESLCLRVEKRNRGQRLYLWIGTTDGTVVLYTSENEGESWDMSFEVGAGTMPFADISVDGKRYVYRFDGSDVLGIIYDAFDNILVPEFTALSGVEEEGGCARESVTGLGEWRIVIQVKVAGAITQYESENGIDFS